MKFCHHPWVGLDISPQGDFKPCCKYNRTIARDLESYLASDELAELKQSFERGEQPPGCQRCWRDEEAGLPSKRELDWEYVFNKTDPDPDYIAVISMPFGNTCNLACRICGSHASSKWGAESRKLAPYFPEIPIHDHQRYYRDERYMQHIKSLLQRVQHIEFPGGEPFLAGKEQHIDFLDHIIGNGSKDVSLHYITNGTQMPCAELLERWSQFKRVDLQISIDGIYGVFEYNRWPADWETVYMNVKYFNDGLRSVLPNLQISISHSVSVFTVWHLQEFVSWCRQEGLPDPYLGLVSRPEHYAITVLPTEAKQAITERSIDPVLKPVLDAMWVADHTDRLDTLMRYVKILDKHRDQSFPDTFPELYQRMGEKCHTLYQLY